MCRIASEGMIAAPDGAAVHGHKCTLGRASPWSPTRPAVSDHRRVMSSSPTGFRVEIPDDESMRISHEAIY